MAATTSEGNACFPNVAVVGVVWIEGGGNTELFEFVFGMVSAGCGNISVKSNGDNAPSSPSTIGKAFESQSLFSTTALGSCCWMGGTLLIFLFAEKRGSIFILRVSCLKHKREREMLQQLTLTVT